MPAHAQDDMCTWDYSSIFNDDVPEPQRDFVGVHAALSAHLYEHRDRSLPAPADDAAARAAMCSDGACAGTGPWLVLLSAPDGGFTDWVWAIVTRDRRRLHFAYVWRDRESLCGPLTATLEHEGTSWVSRVGYSTTHTAGGACTRWTRELHMLVDVERRTIAAEAIRAADTGERSTVSYRIVGNGDVISGCGDERTEPAVLWMRWDGALVDNPPD